jgi:hypothetical protein
MADKNNELSNLLVVGNAFDERQGNNQRGWFIGHFVSPARDLRCTQNIEVKWGVHQPNEEKPTYSVNEKAATLTILISGSFVMIFPDLNSSITLKRTGDYVIFAPRVPHAWKALEDSVVLTVRWPSIPDDQKQVY